MKKLNRKGFTLIELLAVVVVLAIVLVVTIPSVLRSVGNARTQSLENAANSVADWLTRQYELKELENTGVTTDTAYDELPATLGTSESPTTLDNDLLVAAGFSGGTADATGTAWMSGNKICVELDPSGASATNGGRFKGVEAKSSTGC